MFDRSTFLINFAESDCKLYISYNKILLPCAVHKIKSIESNFILLLDCTHSTRLIAEIKDEAIDGLLENEAGNPGF